jgi:hypothetical protein
MPLLPEILKRAPGPLKMPDEDYHQCFLCTRESNDVKFFKFYKEGDSGISPSKPGVTGVIPLCILCIGVIVSDDTP